MTEIKPVRLWIDGQCFQTASRNRGIGRYVLDLLRGISEHHSEIELLVSLNAAMADAAISARSLLSTILPSSNILLWHGKVEVGGEGDCGYTSWRKRSEVALVHHVNQIDPDVSLSASPFEGLSDFAVPYLGGPLATTRTAAIFYDAIPFRFPDRYMLYDKQREFYHRRLSSYRQFDAVFSISEFSSEEFRSLVGSSNNACIGAGLSEEFIHFLNKYDVSSVSNFGQYILYVGGMDWRKNIDIIPAAISILPEALRRSIKFMIVGEILPWQQAELRRRWKSRGLPVENLMVQGAVDDRTLVDLYKGAIALVQPSFMEGFGLTALEAMACGTPAIAANTGALPEIVGNSEFLFDPTVPQELADRIEKVASERFDPRQLRNLAQEKISSFTWRNVSDRLAAGLRQIETAKPQPRADLIEALELDKDELSDTAILMALAEPEYHAPRLLVDASSTLIADHKTGIQRVVRRICENMFPANADNPERRIAFCEDFTGWYFAKEWTGQPPSKQESNRLQPKAGDTVLMLDSSWAFHTIHPLYLHPSRLKGSEVISCLYDTVPLFSSAFCHPGMPPVFAEWFQTALTYSTGFVCISRAVADELLALLEAIRFPRPIKVGFWQLGADFAVTQAAATAKRPGKAGRRPSFLMVGTLEPRKGHRVALEAFETLWAAGVEAELIIVGRVGWGTAYLIERMRASPEFGQRLIWHERVDDEGLAALYACADALVAASFAEGFGLPIVEAGHFGKPVLASDIPVFREVGQGAAGAAFFKVGDPASLAMLVRNFLKNGSASKKRAPDWPTWAQSAAQLEEVVCGQNWYKVYEPQCHRPFVPLTDLGHTRMRAALEDEQRNHRLELVEGPYRTDDDTAWKIVVSVTNLSMICWSSLGPTDGQMGVVLGYHAVDAAGERFQYDNARAHIPFVLVPGDTHYMALNIPASLKERGAAFVDIELYQEGVSWFGNPLRVPL